MRLKDFYRSASTVKHLIWALPLSLSILAVMWWGVNAAWIGAELDRPSKNWLLPMFYNGVWSNCVFSGLVATIPILLANWSRTIWPRIALAVLLLLVQAGATGLFFLTRQ